VRRALDLLVFAPVGLVLTVVEDLPALITKGRRRFETDVRNARVVGQFLVDHGQREVVDRVGKLLGGGPSEDESESETETDSQSTPASAQPATAPNPPAPPVPKPDPDPADALIVEAALAGYDTLSASQVVRRLESLGPDELRAVHRHEASHRNRRTILNRAQQLLDAAGSDAAAGPDSPVG
jgi:hypothetical protein